MQGSFNSASQSPYGSPSVQATVPGSVVSTASVASPTGAAVSSPEDMVSSPNFLWHYTECYFFGYFLDSKRVVDIRFLWSRQVKIIIRCDIVLSYHKICQSICNQLSNIHILNWRLAIVITLTNNCSFCHRLTFQNYRICALHSINSIFIILHCNWGFFLSWMY